MHKGLPPMFFDGMSFQVFRTMRVLGYEVSQRAQAAGLSRTWGMIMGHLSHVEEGLTATDLCQSIGVTAASMSKTLADMEQDGLVSRTPNPEDARSMLVHLTEAGKKRLKVFPAILTEIEETAFEGFTDDELEKLRSMLERIRQNLGDEANRHDLEMMQKEKAHLD